MQSVATVTVNTDAIIRNWQRLKTLHGGGETAAVVKANAYGLGVEAVSRALQGAGCTTFFVATLEEGIELRRHLPESDIFVFQGLLKNEAPDYVQHGLRPVLNTPEQLTQWQEEEGRLPAAIHIDTGMLRLGMTLDTLKQPDVLAAAKTAHADLLMTHYASSSEMAHPLNARQLTRIEEAGRLLPHLKTSYANSGAHFLPPAFHGAMTRPGCALYGIAPSDAPDATMEPVATLKATILQVREITEVETLGYGGTAHVQPGMRVATLGIGYADGIHRVTSNRLYGYVGDYKVPLLGRVTMDMLCFDVSAVPEVVLAQEGAVTLMDHRQTVDDLARIYGTIGYEVLTSLGRRVARVVSR